MLNAARYGNNYYSITMVKKQLYEAPEAELLAVRFEENFLTSPNTPGGYNGDNDLGELDDDEG